MPRKNSDSNKIHLAENVEKKANSKKMSFLYIFSIFILIIVVVAFIGGPLMSRAGSRGRFVFGYYKDKPIEFISGNFFARQRDIISEQARNAGEPDNVEYQIYQIWREAFDETVTHVAVLTEAEASGLAVSDKKIDSMLATYPGFMENGKFSIERYRNTSSSEKFELRNLYSETYIHEKYLTDNLTGHKFTTAEIDFLKDLASPERKFSYIFYSFDDYPDEEVSGFGSESSDLFRKIKLSSLSVNSSEEEAASIRQQIVDKVSSFENLVKTYSKDIYADKGGEIGDMFYHQLKNSLTNDKDADHVIALETGEISEVLQTPFGWIIYRCDAEAVSADFEEEETITAVRDYMNRFERGRIEDYLIVQAETFKATARETSFENACIVLDILPGSTDYFPINYGSMFFLKQVNPEGKEELANAGTSESFFKTLFSLELQEISEPVIMRDTVMVSRLDDEKDADENSVSYIDSFYPYLLQQYTEEDLDRIIRDSEYFQDDFNSAYRQFINPN
jgi:peptidyl-prolyl cis-trans isomerase D